MRAGQGLVQWVGAQHPFLAPPLGIRHPSPEAGSRRRGGLRPGSGGAAEDRARPARQASSAPPRAHAVASQLDGAGVHVTGGGAQRANGLAGEKQAEGPPAAAARAWPRSTGVWRGECGSAEGTREGRLGSGWRAEGRKPAAGLAGWCPRTLGSGHFGLLSCGALRRSGVCARGDPACARPHPGRRGLLCFTAEPHPSSVP